jgi:hypothetical protein
MIPILDTIHDCMTAWQWARGDSCYFRMLGVGPLIRAYVENVDVRTRRLEVTFNQGERGWIYCEWAFKP